MLFLLLAIITSACVAIIIKLFDKFQINSFQAIGINYVICIIAGIIALRGYVSLHSIPRQDWFWFAVILGFGFIAMFNVFAISSGKIGIALTTVSSKMSVIVPVYFGIILYGDNFNFFKIAGVIFTLLAFYFIFKKEKNIPFRKLYFFLPLLLFIGNGFNDTLQTYAQRIFIMNDDDILLFMIIIFSSALLLSILIFIYKFFMNNHRITLPNIFAGIVLGIFNFSTTFFFLKTIGIFQSTFVFPVFNVSIVGISALAGVAFFNEKLRMINWIGIVLAAMAITVIALG